MDTPVIYDKNAGYKGKQQGEINDNKPAPNENKIFKSPNFLLPFESIEFHIFICKYRWNVKGNSVIILRTMIIMHKIQIISSK